MIITGMAHFQSVCKKETGGMVQQERPFGYTIDPTN